MTSPERSRVMWLAEHHRLIRIVGVLVGLVGLVLLFVGVGSAVDLLVTQSQPVGLVAALSVGAEFTVVGVVLSVVGLVIVWWTVGGRNRS